MESDASGGDGGLAENGGALPPPFLGKTYDMVDDPATNAIVSWGAENNTFVVWNTPEFARDLLPKYFKHNNFSSFVRQLNTYGFRKVDTDKWEFANEGFLRGKKDLLRTIHRRKTSHVPGQMPQPQTQSTPVAVCVEVGKFGLEEEIERLKRDKNVLMHELIRLRQQQQTSDNQLQTLGKLLQGMEQRQQQMMSFLAKGMHNPGFFAQFVQQNDSNRRLAAANKKRRLPKQEGHLLDSEIAFPDGQIIRYQPLIKEAGKAMLSQILKVNSSPRLEPLSNSHSFLPENFASTSETFNDTSSIRNSRITLSEVPSGFSAAPYMTVSSGFSAVCSSSATSGNPSAGLANNSSSKEQAGVGILPSVPEGMSMPEFSELQNIAPEDSVINAQGEGFIMCEPASAYVNPIAMEVDETVPLDTDILYDDDQKLPGINDSFWAQFLSGSSPPLSGDTEEAESTTKESEEMLKRSENGWASTRNM
ncbi:heat stress transcription factor A-1-like [Typha angustifolia]|uniref:heat stress transcription factor A-1-like n=1 Tax=Typha angustifolia TaxID=59011 RepID=UPI003C2CB4D6